MRRMGKSCCGWLNLLRTFASTYPRRRVRAGTDFGPVPFVTLGFALSLTLAWPAFAQIERPVYVDDSPRAAEGLIRAQELAAIGNLNEAVRVLQLLLDTEGQRVLPIEDDPQLFIPVRRHVNQVLLEDPELLDRYRELNEPRAADQLESGDFETIERTLLMTTSGFEATLRLAQQRLEQAMFEAAHLTMLELEHHPDRRDQRRTESAQLLTLIASYVGAEANRELAPLVRSSAARDAARWRQQAGLVQDDPAEVDMPRFRQASTPLDRGELTDLDGLVQGPPWSRKLGPDSYVRTSNDPRRNASAPNGNQRSLFALPTRWGDLVFTNNGRTIVAWNRFTLDPIWEASEPREHSRQAMNNQQRVSEPTLVAVGRGLVVGLSGLNFYNDRSPADRRLFARDAETGELLWTVLLDQILEQRPGATVLTGPPIIDQGVAIIGIDRDDQQRRLDGAMLAAFDLRDGSLRWMRTLGSCGAVNFQPNSGGVNTITRAGGVLYGVHRLGFAYALESATGRIRWIRRERAGATNNSRPLDQAWEMGIPVLRADVVYTLSPDRSAILKLSRRTGRIISQMPATQLDSPAYLLTAGDMLVGVSRNNIFSIPFSDFATGESGRSIGSLEGKVISGRVISTGDLLLVPTEDSLRIFTPDHDSLRPEREVSLDRSGNILPLASELLVVDDREIHAYLVWDMAQRMLMERLAENPDDPAPPITFAELAFRAGKFDLVIELIDTALNTVERAPLAASSEQALARMFEALRHMFEGQAPYASVARPALALRGELLMRLGRCATSTPQRATFLLLRSEHYRETGEYARAVEQLQSILDAPDLAQANIQSNNISLLAQREATMRLRTLISAHGTELYEPYEAEAMRQLASLAQELDPDPFEAIARRYPASAAASRALAEAASRYERLGNQRLATQALEEAIKTARAAAIDADDPLRGEINGRLVLLYLQANRFRLARDHIERLAIESPNLILTDNGSALDLEHIAQQIERAVSLQPRRPLIGHRAVASEELVGWSIERGWAPFASSGVTDRLMMRSGDDAETLALWAINADEKLEMLWSVREEDEIFLWLGRRGVFMMREEGQGDRVDPVIILRDAQTGTVRWRVGPFRTLFDRSPIDAILDQAGANVPRLNLPNPVAAIESPPVTEVRGEFDDQTLVLADRMGRLVGIDLDTGRILWTRTRVVERLYDLDVQLGTILVGGSDVPLELNANRQGERLARTDPGGGVVVALDARTGTPIVRPHRVAGGVRWVRLAGEGLAAFATEDQITTFGLYLDRNGWTSTHEDLRDTSSAWAIDSRLILRREGRNQLAQIPTGAEPEVTMLDTSELLADRFDSLRVERLGDHALVITSAGMALFDETGALAGRNLRERTGRILLSGISETYVPALARAQQIEPNAQFNRFELTFYTAASLRAAGRVEIETGADPHSLAILDGLVLISSGAITTIIEVPPDQEPGAGAAQP